VRYLCKRIRSATEKPRDKIAGAFSVSFVIPPQKPEQREPDPEGYRAEPCEFGAGID